MNPRKKTQKKPKNPISINENPVQNPGSTPPEPVSRPSRSTAEMNFRKKTQKKPISIYQNPVQDAGSTRPEQASRPSRSKDDQDPQLDTLDCSGKHCKSCSAAVIADCVAICCCPLAIISFLALAFVKVPYLMSKKCYRGWKMKRKCKNIETENRDRTGKQRRSEIEGLEERERSVSAAAFEADKVLFELGHLGFGRVSFTDIQSFDKST